MEQGYKIEEVVDPSEDLKETGVYDALRTHNQQVAPDFWAARELPENEPKEVSLFAYDEAGKAVGGLLGTTEFSWLKLDLMSTHKEVRGQGIGQELLERAENLARERGCKYSFVDTMEDQAAGFYQKFGYQVAGQIPDWDSHGHKKFFLVKTL